MLELALGAVCISFAPIFVKLIHLGPAAIGAYRCLFAAAILAPLALTSPAGSKPRGEYLPLLTLAGAAFAVDLVFWHIAIANAGAGVATILANTQVFFLSLIGIVFLGERPDRRFLIAVPLAFAGTAALVWKPQSALEQLAQGLGVHDYRWGVICGFIAAAAYSLYLLILRRAERAGPKVPKLKAVFFVSLASGLMMAAEALRTGELEWPSPHDLGALLGLAAVAQVAGWLLITRGLPKVRISIAALILLLQSMLATVMSRLFFDERLAPHQILGAVVTLTAIYLGSLRASGRSAGGRR